MTSSFKCARWNKKIIACLTMAALGLSGTARAGDSDARAFAHENDVAMAAMMRGMSVKPTADVDHDFAVMMIAHHKGAVDMAMAELRHGSNERLRRIAQAIVVEQPQEIAAMQLVIDQELTPQVPAPRSPQRRLPSAP